MFENTDVILVGTNISLIPLREDHANRLYDLSEGVQLWQWYPDKIATLDDMVKVVKDAIEARDRNEALPFTIISNKTKEIIGSSRFFNASAQNKRLEIGWTWIAPKVHGKHVNTEAKLLMLDYAFEALDCNRVELKTDSRNLASQKAMTKLGFTREGIFRSHMITHDGSIRDSVYFSIIRSEWNRLKTQLQEKLSYD